MKKGFRAVVAAVLACCTVATAGFAVGCKKPGEYDKYGNVILEIANLYMTDLGDAYTDYVQDKFGVSISPKGYSWTDWDSQVTSAVNGDNMPHVFHWNLEADTFPTLERWARGGSLRALPDDLSAYPNVARLVSEATAIEQMKIGGKLYCLPLVRNPQDTDTVYSEFTYVYRKDWAKRLAAKNPTKYGDLYKADDVYTYAEFERLLNAFKDEDMAGNGKTVPLADVEWSFPSVANYFKDAPHAYVLNAQTGKYEWNFATPAFTAGLEKAKKYVEDGIYWADQYAAKEGDAMTRYKSGVVGCYFDNCTLTNYSELRKSFAAANPSVDLDEGTALMRLKRDDGKFVYEEANNWWSATLFSADITDAQLNKFLEIMNWLLSDEGTMFSTYGFEDSDYAVKDDGSIELFWSKKTNGAYAPKVIGARYLRFAASLGYDVIARDPLIDDATKAAHTAWEADIDKQFAANSVKLLPLYPEMNWLSLPNKNANAGLFNEAQAAMTRYAFGDGGWDTFNQNNASKYTAVVDEVNTALGL